MRRTKRTKREPKSCHMACGQDAAERDSERDRHDKIEGVHRGEGALASGPQHAEQSCVGNGSHVERHETPPGTESGEPLVIPAMAEDLEVDKRGVERGKVRITKVVHERDEVTDEPLFREDVEIERIPIERVVAGPISVRHEGETLIVSIVEEILVLEKRFVLKEELHIRKRCRGVLSGRFS